MKKFFVCLLGIAVASGAYATTKTVGKTGAEFTSIQAAIDSFTDAELSDGQPDVVEIIDTAEYDEQVAIGGLIPDPASQAPGYLDEVIAFAENQDPFTLRGTDAATRPKINPVTEGVAYGVFSDNPDDNFIATFSYLGKDITVENVEIIQSSQIDGSQYGINGQAGNMTFRNVLFSVGDTTDAGEALVNLNNDVNLVDEGFDNSYTFVDCTFDASFGEVRGGGDSFYFHGYSADDITAAGLTPEQAAVNVTFQNCDFLNSSTVMHIRGNAQANNVTVDHCYLTNSSHGIRASGQGTMNVRNSIFYQNAATVDDFDDDYGAIETVGRSGYTPALSVRNSLFVDNLDADTFQGGTGQDTRAATIRIQNDGTDPAVEIVGNTFVNCPVVFRFVDSSGRPRNATISNNIFQNVGILFTVYDMANGSYLESANVDANGAFNELVVTGANNVFEDVTTVVEEAALLPNVNIGGSQGTVTFTNPTITTGDPFAGPPYVVASGAGDDVGADLSDTTGVKFFMLY